MKKLIESYIRSMENEIKIKVVEKPGPKVLDVIKMIVKKDERLKCEEEYCMMCKKENSGNCNDSSIVYRIICQTCLKNKKKSIYIGETSKSGQERSIEHVTQSLSMSEIVLKKSVLIRHNVSDHDGERADYKMEKIKAFQRKPLQRQGAEGAQIRKLMADPSVNLVRDEEHNGEGKNSKITRIQDEEETEIPKHILDTPLHREGNSKSCGFWSMP